MFKAYTQPVFILWIQISLLILTASTAQAVGVGGDYQDLSASFEFLVDEEGLLRLEDIQQADVQSKFQSAAKAVPQRGRQDAALWLKIELSFEAGDTANYVLTTLVNNFSEIWIYRQEGGSFREYRTGNNYPALQRELPASRYAFVIKPSLEPQTIYLRTTGAIDTFQIPWVIADKNIFDRNNERFNVINLVIVGAIAGVLILCVGIGFTLGSANYLVYSAFLLFGLISLTNQDGLGFMLFWPNHPSFNDYAVDIFNLGVAFVRLLTIVVFLNIRELAPRLFIACSICLAILAVLFLFAITTGLKPVSEYIGGIAWLVSMLFGTGISIYAIFRKAPLAIPMFIILNIPVFGNFYQAGISTGVFEISVLGLQAAKITFVIHALLFSMCLAYEIQRRINTRRVAQLDNLTGLPRLTLAKTNFQYAAAVADQYDWKIAVLFIDLDGFKAVNDKFGHKLGDKLLQEVARRLNDQLREVDTAARVGGDEFVVIQTEVKDEQAYTVVAENLQKSLSSPFIIDGNHLPVTASIGVALYPDHGHELTELMKVADHAMYSIKKSGKNAFQLAPPVSVLEASQESLS